MKFEYLVLADAVNFSGDGKVNILGLGWRQANLPQLPGPFSFSVAASLSADPAEAGEYQAEFSLLLPDGTEELLSRTPVALGHAPDATRLFLGVALDVVGKPFSQPGLYTVRAQVGSASAEYQFRVVTAAPAAPTMAEPAPDVPRKRHRNVPKS